MAKKKTLGINPDVKLDPVTSLSDVTISAQDYVSDAYFKFGQYVNTQRQLPYLADGLKPVYRRVIHSCMKLGASKFLKTAKIASDVIASTHPHGLASVEGVVSALVRTGILEGQGNHGASLINGMVLPPAASRYTEAKISQKYLDIFNKVSKMIPMVESPMGDLEPTFIGTPLPLGLVFSLMGLGLGVNTRVPSFSAVSMFDAYKNNNPNLLKCNYNLDIDYAESELDKLWTTGKGKVVYKYKVTRATSVDGAQGVLIEGDTELFTPNLSWFYAQQDQERLFVREETDKNGPKLFIGRNHNVKAISIDDIEEQAIKACKSGKVYLLNVTDGTDAYRIPLRDWIDYSYNNYLNLVDKKNKDEIAATEYEIKVNDAIPSVADYIINKNPKADNKEISEKLSLDPGIVSSILQKPISYIRKTKEASDRSKALSSKLKELKSFDKVKFTDEVIMKL